MAARDIGLTTELSPPTLGHHLNALEELGAISGNLPAGERRSRSVAIPPP
ncbi:ArsR family transcriptional regulator [Crystallibacter crystallopoietes]